MPTPRRTSPAADAEYQHAFAHTYALGGTLASALLPKKDAAALAAPGWQLRTNLTEALSEHVALVIAAMRAASGSNVSDFKGLGDALNHNTEALAGSIGTLFGEGGRYAASSHCGPTMSTGS